MLEDAFFQAQCIGMVFVVIVNHREAPVAVALVQGNRGRVVSAYFQPQVGAIMLKGNGVGEVLPDLWPMLAFVGVAGALALLRYRKTLD